MAIPSRYRMSSERLQALKEEVNYLETVSDTEPFWQRNEVPRRNPDDKLCGIGMSTLTFRPNGNISPCIPHPAILGNIATNDLASLWRHSAMLNEMRNLKFKDVSPKCSTCPHSGFCAVCPGASVSEYGDIGPSPYSCRHAALKHKLFLSRRFAK